MIGKLTRTIVRTFAFALALCATTSAWAAKPVAVWDGAADSVYDFSSLTHNGYVLGNLGSGYYNSVAADYSYLQIGNENQKAAITLKKSSGNMGASTVIIRCENLMDHESCNRAVLSFLNNNNPYIGVGQYKDGSHKSSFIWDNNMWNNSANVMKDGAFSGSPTTIALAYSYAQGTAYYVDGKLICSASGLCASGYNPQGVCIGGVGADGSTAFYAMKGMKITAIAFFDSKITDDDIAAYRFPSECVKYIKINADTSVSAINAQIDTANFESNTVCVANGVRITVDEAFDGTSEAPLPITSAGSITLYADPQPATSYFTGVDFSGVKGGVLRSWLTPGVVGYNFKSNSGSDTSVALVSGGTWLPASTADQASGSTTEMFADGLSTFEWSSKNTWSWSSGTLLNGYLDDGGSQANITLSNVPYERYDVVVYAATDTEDASFKAVTVNGTQYTWDENSGEAVTGSATWGISHQPLAVYGKNALRIKNLSGPLKIKGGSNSNGARGCIAAVQIMPTTAADVEVKDYTLTLDGTAKNWSTGTWTSGGIEVSAPTLARNVEIVATASTALTIDSAVKVSQLTISGAGASVVTMSNGSGGSLSVGEVVVASGILKPNGTPSTSMKLTVQDGGAIDLASAAASGYDVKIAGQGVLKDGVYTGALFSSANISGGSAQLRGITLTANATIRCDKNWGIIRSGWNPGTLNLGSYTLTKVGSENFWICNVADNGTGGIVVNEGKFTPIYSKSTFNNATLTLKSGATFRMDASDGGGSTDFQIKNLACEAGSTVDIAANRTLTVTTALTANGTMKPLGTVTCNGNMTIGGDVVVPSDKTWTVAGTLTVADGGKLEIKNNALVPGALALADGGTLKIAKVSDAAHKVTAGTVTFPASGAAIIDVSDIPDLDENDEVDVLTGNTSLPSDVSTLKIVGKQCSLESESNTLKVVNDGGLVWDDGWTTGKDPTMYGDAVIASSGTVALAGTSLSFNSVTLSGSGTVSFSATGSETVSIKNLEIGAGVTLTANSALDLTGCEITGDGTLDIPAGTTYAMNGVTSSAKVTVEGTLETSGETTLSAANTSAAGSFIEVVAGTTTLASKVSGIEGNITIAYGAELVAGKCWAPNDDDWYLEPIKPTGTTILDISGTLTLNTYIWYFGAGTTINLRSGASISGTGRSANYGNLSWTGNGTLNCYANTTINAAIRTKADVSPVFNVADGVTLTIDSAFVPQTSTADNFTGSGSITKAGAGTLCLKNVAMTKPISGSEGTLQLLSDASGVKTHTATSSFSGKVIITRNTNGGHHEIGTSSDDDSNPGVFFLSGSPELEINGSAAYLCLNRSFAGKYMMVKNLSATSGTIDAKYTSGGTSKTIKCLQTDDTTYAGNFNGGGTTARYVDLLVYGQNETVKTLTLSGASDTMNSYGTLTVKDYGKVIFSGSGDWAAGTVVVGANGYLESSSSAETLASTLTLQDGATMSFVPDKNVTVTTLNLPSGEGETVTFDINYVPALEGTTLISSSSITANTDVGMIQCENAIIKAEEEAIKAYPVATVTTFGSDAVVAYSSVQDAIDNARAENNQYVTAYQSATVIAAGQILLKIADGAVVTLNSSKAGCAYDGGIHIADGIYMFSDSVEVAATFKWNTAFASGSWGATANWTSDDGTVSRIPGSLDTVIFESDATVETPTSGFSFAALQANASVTIKRDKWAIDDRLTRTVSAYGAISGTGSLTLNDGVNLANASGASLSIGVPVTVAGATALTVAEGVAASFTGSGTLTLNAITSTPIVGDGWTGTVWLQNLSNVTIVPVNYGNADSVIKFTGVSGQIAAGTICSSAVELEDDGDTKALTLNSYSTTTVSTITFNEFRGSGTFATVGGTADAYPRTNFRILKWDDFVGSLDVDRGRAVFGTDTISNDDWRYIYISEDADVTIAAGKSFTANQGLRVYGELTVESNDALSSKAVQGSGTIIYEVAPNNGTTKPSFHATLWTGVVEFQEFAAAGIKLAEYGTSNSKIKINGITSGHLMWEDQNVQAEVVLAGDVNITATSHRNYTYAHISGTGSFSVSNSNASNADPNRLTITKLDVASGSVGMAVTNNTSTTLTINKLVLPAIPACDAKVLAVGGNGEISLDVSDIKFGVNEESLPAKYKLERRHVREEGDGFYVYYNGAIFSVY